MDYQGLKRSESELIRQRLEHYTEVLEEAKSLDLVWEVSTGAEIFYNKAVEYRKEGVISEIEFWVIKQMYNDFVTAVKSQSRRS